MFRSACARGHAPSPRVPHRIAITPRRATRPTMPADQYDTDVTTWSPQGRLFQVEYAMEAVKQGSACVGVTSNDFVVLAALKRCVARRAGGPGSAAWRACARCRRRHASVAAPPRCACRCPLTLPPSPPCLPACLPAGPPRSWRPTSRSSSASTTTWVSRCRASRVMVAPS